ncbi:MAG: hypothetical protein AAB893_04040 [Patescibacteria group bacterium]
MKVSCAFCSGTGVQPHSLKMNCLSCHGKGEVEFEHAAVMCSACKGSGRASDLSALSCIQCRGVGMVEKEQEAGVVEKIYEEIAHEEKRTVDIIKSILRRIVKGLSGAGKWIKNQLIKGILWSKTILTKTVKGLYGAGQWIKSRLIKEILWFKTIFHKIKRHS